MALVLSRRSNGPTEQDFHYFYCGNLGLVGDPCAVLLPSILPFDMYMSGTRRRSGRAPEMQFANQFSLCLFLADTLNLIVILIWNDTTYVQILFINWLRVVVWCCSFLCLFVCLFAKYALRVPPAVTRLTVYRRLRVETY